MRYDPPESSSYESTPAQPKEDAVSEQKASVKEQTVQDRKGDASLLRELVEYLRQHRTDLREESVRTHHRGGSFSG